jgi:P pilus assembly chaperone PapD
MHASIFKQKSLRTRTIVYFFIAISGLALSLFIPSAQTMAQGNLLLTPRRIVFEGAKKSMELNLANTGTDTAKYVISIIRIRMTDDGAFETITEPDSGQLFADPYLRFFPRTVSLGPNEAQVVKIQLTKTSDLAPGEYRSHVYFRAVPNLKPLGEEETQKDTTTISVKLTPVFGITIPVIIRVGESTTKVSLSNLALEMVNDTTTRLKLTFNRTGNFSVYGDVTVTYTSPDGKITQVGMIKGLAVYSPNKLRNFQFDLNKANKVNYHAGKLYIEYSTQAEPKAVKMADAELVLH